jgi:membrane protease subunit HflK
MKNPWEEFDNKHSTQPKDSFLNQNFKKFHKPQNIPFLQIAFAILAIFIAYSCFYIVNQDEKAIILRFGKVARLSDPGIHFKLPYPIEVKIINSVLRVRTSKISSKNLKNYYSKESSRKGEKKYSTAFLLTKDENLIDIEFDIQWKINDFQNYVFSAQNVEAIFYEAAHGVIRESIGYENIENLLTTKRADVELRIKSNLQSLLDYYKSGVEILSIQMLKIDPPEEVINAFRDVQTARVDKETKVNDALAYKSKIIPEARGYAQKIIIDAKATKQSLINDAIKENLEFSSLYKNYSNSKAVTKSKMYYEIMTKFLNTKHINIIDQNIKNLILKEDLK